MGSRDWTDGTKFDRMQRRSQNNGKREDATRGSAAGCKKRIFYEIVRK